MKTLIINNHTIHLEKLLDLFPDSEVIPKESIKTINPNNYELIVMSGGTNVPTVLRHPETYLDEIFLIKDSTVPILGICLGSELVVHAFGGELMELPENHRGTVALDIIDAELEFALDTKGITVEEGHRVVAKSIPDDFISCAVSDHGIEIFRHSTRSIIGLQFHPELKKNQKLQDWILQTLKLK